ncbi:hypothetical protein K0T92_05840 [Paenibacillus oenotherae]|uniref:Uncharacterized protein n=1 Tax=Paenibacillus oenotherae TaxID=1435645 RepID=A0ABS7D2X9_9BACL|nr:hypothetical protein [Paenibacillus oenotherae]MBW7474258.1 hypothetical protein [Paenibacillus oenotherae]
MNDESTKKLIKAPRWRRWLLAFGVMLLLLLGAAWYAYDRMTDHLLQVLMEDSMLPIEASEPLATDAQREGEQNKPLSDQAVRKLSNKGSGGANDTSAPVDRNKGADQSSADDAAAAAKPSSSSKAAARTKPSSNGGQQSAAGKTSAADKQALSAEEAREAGDKVTMMEKIEIGSVLMKHWSVEELKAFQSALGGGLTIEEKRELKRKAMEQLSEEEYDRLIKIAKKYGMSRGKSYQQSLDEK